jgi:hypothetical protein
MKPRSIRWVGRVEHMGEMRNTYKILVEKSEGMRPCGRPARRWDGNIRRDLREIGREVVDWMHLAQDRY